MRKQGGGQIINVASVAGLQGYPTEAIYCASKFAQVGMTQALDREFYKEGIKVTAARRPALPLKGYWARFWVGRSVLALPAQGGLCGYRR